MGRYDSRGRRVEVGGRREERDTQGRLEVWLSEQGELIYSKGHRGVTVFSLATPCRGGKAVAICGWGGWQGVCGKARIQAVDDSLAGGSDRSCRWMPMPGCRDRWLQLTVAAWNGVFVRGVVGRGELERAR
jgi:hypothetical protein